MAEQPTTQFAEQVDLQERIEQLQQLTKTDPDPRVRRRAQAVLLVADGESLASVARIFPTAAHRVQVWRMGFLAEGRTGLVDRVRRGRPPTLDATDLAFLSTALEQGPQVYGLPITVWSVRDVQALLARERGVQVSVYTVHRAIQALGYRYRRPRHDLTHRQDAAAVAAAKQVLDWLQKKRLLSPDDSIWSMWMRVQSTPIPPWQRSGGRRGGR